MTRLRFSIFNKPITINLESSPMLTTVESKMPAYRTIKTPGKFQGCPEFVPALWDLINDGLADETFDFPDGPVYYMVVDDVPGVFGVRLWASQGTEEFVHSDVLKTQKDWLAQMREDERALARDGYEDMREPEWDE